MNKWKHVTKVKQHYTEYASSKVRQRYTTSPVYRDAVKGVNYTASGA